MKLMRLYKIVMVLLLMAACTSQSSPSANPEASSDAPAEAVEQYLTAKVAGDEAGVRARLCAEMESELAREARSFVGVEGAKIEGMECTSGDGNTVSCTGEILATYGTEQQSFPLSSYRVVEEDGEWKWCGEADAS